MSEEPMTLGELADHLKVNRTHLGKRVREDENFPRLNTNPGGKRARYRFYLSEVVAYMREKGEGGSGKKPVAEAVPVAAIVAPAEDLDPLVRIS